MTREDMINEVVRTRGMSSQWTHWFCELEESNISDNVLLKARTVALEMPEEEMEEL